MARTLLFATPGRTVPQPWLPKLGRRLLDHGSAGFVYPSVRNAGGTCIACFRPALVGNVREGALVTFTFPDAFHALKVKVSR